MNKSIARRIAAVCLIVLLMGAAGFALLPSDDLTFTAQATVYAATDDACYVSENNGYQLYSVYPYGKGSVWEDSRKRSVKFRNGAVSTGFGHGPNTLTGYMALDDLREKWEQIPLQADWPFSVSLYNTSEGRKFRVYLDIEIYTDQPDAKATLYVFYPDSAHPVICTWSGKIGEEIRFILEV